VRWRVFYRRRLLRIVPAYWVALIVLSIWPGLPGFSDHTWRYFTFTQIYWIDSATQGIGPAWSLCIEMSFYLVLPLLAAGIARLVAGRARTVRIELGVLALLALASGVLRSVVKAQGGIHVVSTTLVTYFDWFAIGMALAVLSVAWQDREPATGTVGMLRRRAWLSWAAAGVVYVIVATQFDLPRGFFAIYTDVGYQARHIGYALVALLLLLPAVFGVAGGGWPRRVLAHPLAMWLGLISYAIFLYQVPLTVYLRTHQWWNPLPGLAFPMQVIATTLLTVAFAVASYHLVERPILRHKDRAPR
jgi:peptidoglycan/LPS O-acetylase OafA/YrhL